MSDTMPLNLRDSLAPAIPAGAERSMFLTFSLGGEAFAVAISFIKEVMQFSGLTAVPLVPDTIRGVINLRGSVVPVIDLSVRFGRSPTPMHRRTCIVVLELFQNEAQTVLGILVDQVREVLSIGQDEMEPTPAFGGRLPLDFISSVGKVGGKFVPILDVDRALAVAELAV
jgi:purine-binding chemotaxis protein CheW